MHSRASQNPPGGGEGIVVKPNTFVIGDSLAVLREVKAETFHACVTSPPY